MIEITISLRLVQKSVEITEVVAQMGDGPFPCLGVLRQQQLFRGCPTSGRVCQKWGL